MDREQGKCAGCIAFRGVNSALFNDGGKIHIVCDSHHLGAGKLNAEVSAMLPNKIYPDGTQLIVSVKPLEIELVKEGADNELNPKAENVSLAVVNGSQCECEHVTPAGLNARSPRVIVGRLPRIGNAITHNYYLTPKLPGDGSWIPVRLSTRAFKDWCQNEGTTKPFTINAVGLWRVYLSLKPGDSRYYIRPERSPLNISVEDGVATISKKKPGRISLDPYGLLGDMGLSNVPSDTYNTDNRLIVRYDEKRGLIGYRVPHLTGAFAIDRLAPPTYAEVLSVLNVIADRGSRRSPGFPFQIQFRSRAVRPKGATAVDASKKFHFWSLKKKKGCVFRVRRTLGARYFRTSQIDGKKVRSRSYAHRNFGASEWHYYTVRWETTATAHDKITRILSLRRLG